MSFCWIYHEVAQFNYCFLGKSVKWLRQSCASHHTSCCMTRIDSKTIMSEIVPWGKSQHCAQHENNIKGFHLWSLLMALSRLKSKRATIPWTRPYSPTVICLSAQLKYTWTLVWRHINFYRSHVMRKSLLAICDQQRRRSDCTSAQSEAGQPGLCFTCSETPKRGFLVTRLIE